MKLLIFLSLMLLVPVSVIGQNATIVPPTTANTTSPANTTGTPTTNGTTTTTGTPTTNGTTTTTTPVPTTVDAHCFAVGDLGTCHVVLAECGGNSQCSCKDGKPFCRCNSDKDQWFMGDNCEQKWTVVTFALVASLPGLALALIVGVTVQCVHYFKKPAKEPKDTKGAKLQNKQPPGNHYVDPNSQDGAYSNLMFAGDMPSRAKGPYVQPTQERLPMTNRPSVPYSPQPNVMRPPLDQPTRPAPEYHPYNPQPNGMQPSFDRKPTINPGNQPYNMATGLTQPMGRSPSVRNPYEDRAPPVDRYDDYRPSPPVDRYDDYRPSQPASRHSSVMGGGYPGPAPPAPAFTAPDYNSRAQFPRAQMGRPM